MTPEELERRRERAERETWVISETDDGYRIYSAGKPVPRERSWIFRDPLQQPRFRPRPRSGGKLQPRIVSVGGDPRHPPL